MTGRFLFDDQTDGCSHAEAGALGASFVEIDSDGPFSITFVDTTDAVRRVYDALRQSMDYGSGMLDTEDMQALLLLGTLMDASDLLNLRADTREASMGQVGPHDFVPDRPGDATAHWDDRPRCTVCGGRQYDIAHEDQASDECPICNSTVHITLEHHERLMRQAAAFRAAGTKGDTDSLAKLSSESIAVSGAGFYASDPVFERWEQAQHDAAVAVAGRAEVDRRLEAGELDPQDF